MLKIEEQFKSYQEKVIPAGASAAQLTETRRAFYAGAAALMAFLKAIGESDRISESEGEAMLVEIDQELLEFSERVKRGAA